MRNNKNSYPLFRLVGQQTDDKPGVFFIQRPGRLISQQQVRLTGQSPDNGQPLPFTPG